MLFQAMSCRSESSYYVTLDNPRLIVHVIIWFAEKNKEIAYRE